MRVIDRPFEGAVLLERDRSSDERGSFERVFCRNRAAEHGLDFSTAQVNVARNPTRHTLRGLHWQIAPAAETKLFVCLTGALFDVIVDLREGSSSRLRWAGFELRANDARAILIPEGCAHGYLTLEPETSALYLTNAAYDPALQRRARWNDPALAIDWPAPPRVISKADRIAPDLDLLASGEGRAA